MPSAFFRLLAVVLLALAVPVQAMAAVSAGQCMAAGQHQDIAHEHHAHDGADSQDQSSHSHAEESGTQQSHCGPCAACCASASIAGPAAGLILSSYSNTKYVFSQLPPPGVQPDSVDRPPLAL